MARAQTTAADIAAPCKARQATTAVIWLASAAPTLAATYSARPSSSTGRRPSRSDTGPHTSWARPKPRISAAIVNCTAAMPACRSAASAGKAGSIRSVVMGCKPISKASASAANAGDKRDAVGAAGKAVAVMRSHRQTITR